MHRQSIWYDVPSSAYQDTYVVGYTACHVYRLRHCYNVRYVGVLAGIVRAGLGLNFFRSRAVYVAHSPTHTRLRLIHARDTGVVRYMVVYCSSVDVM